MWTPLLSVYLGSNSQPEIVANEALVVWDPLTKHIYLKPKWGPLFWLGFRPSFGRLKPQNRGHSQVPGTYKSILFLFDIYIYFFVLIILYIEYIAYNMYIYIFSLYMYVMYDIYI